jgi:hypothetical protein
VARLDQSYSQETEGEFKRRGIDCKRDILRPENKDIWTNCNGYVNDWTVPYDRYPRLETVWKAPSSLLEPATALPSVSVIITVTDRDTLEDIVRMIQYAWNQQYDAGVCELIVIGYNSVPLEHVARVVPQIVPKGSLHLSRFRWWNLQPETDRIAQHVKSIILSQSSCCEEKSRPVVVVDHDFLHIGVTDSSMFSFLHPHRNPLIIDPKLDDNDVIVDHDGNVQLLQFHLSLVAQRALCRNYALKMLCHHPYVIYMDSTITTNNNKTWSNKEALQTWMKHKDLHKRPKQGILIEGDSVLLHHINVVRANGYWLPNMSNKQFYTSKITHPFAL